ncbi:MAG: ABC transporter permease [Cyanobacteria bacterium P01_A01_bin.135]
MTLRPLDLFQLTARSLWGNPLRSALSMSGVFMGVAAVLATLQVGNISRTVIAEELAEREAPQVWLYPQWQPGRPYRRLQLDDLAFLQQRLVGTKAISAVDWAGVRRAVVHDREDDALMMAVSEAFLVTSGRQLLTGRFFTEADFERYRSVAVIDQFLADNLFDSLEAAIGAQVYFNGRPLQVVGVLETKLAADEEEPTGQVYLPLSLHHALQGHQDIGSLRLRPQSSEAIDSLQTQAEQLLQQRSPERRFRTFNNIEDLQERQQVLQLAARGLAAVGVISLLVGGVGIANIMLASVAERTSEIGLRRAVGATRQEIMLQFVLEAVVLSLVGGSVAVVTVHGLTTLVTQQFDLPYEFKARSAVVALGAAVGVGVGASLLPALQASRLDPVQALRSG